jgi:NAD-dependent deacetylase
MKKINIKKYKSIVFFTGSLMAEESGVLPYLLSGGIWNDYNWQEYACENAFEDDPAKVLAFHEKRRKQILGCKPGRGYYTLTELAKNKSNITVITQNIDGLHQMAGCESVIELNGNIWEVKCPVHGIRKDMTADYESYKCKKCGNWYRPAVTWFGDMLNENKLHVATQAVSNCDLFVCVGASGSIWPAAKLAALAKKNGALCVEINTEETDISGLFDAQVKQPASVAIPALFQKSSSYVNKKPVLILALCIAFSVGVVAEKIRQKIWGDDTKSKIMLKQTPGSETSDFNAMMEEAVLLVKSNDYLSLVDFIYNNDWLAFDLEAKRFLKQTIITAVNNFAAKENYERAIELIKKYVTYSGYDTPIMKKLAGLYMVSDKPFLAYETYLELADNLPDNGLRNEIIRKSEELRNNFFRNCRKEQNWSDLIAFCNEFAAKEPETASLYAFEKARAFIATGETMQARSLLERLLYDDAYMSLAESYLKSLDGYKIPITVRQNNEALFVNVSINGIGKALLLIDTGATMVCISPAVAEQSDIFVNHEMFADKEENGAAELAYAPVEIADTVQVGDAVIENIAIAVKEIHSEYGKIDGLLGMNYLKHFDFTIDINEGILHLKRKKY